MSNKQGRNDPCSCGSGKKYKKCCTTTLQSFQPSEVADFEWRKLRQLEGIVLDKHLIPYATQTIPAEVMKQALLDCLPEDLPEELDTEILFNNFFIPWFLFNWIPFNDFGLEQFDPEVTLAQNYVHTHEKALNSREKQFIEAMDQSFYSFYSVLRVEKDKALFVKDIILGTTHTIKERQGTHQLKRGDVIFSRILTLDKQSIFVGMAPFIVPIDYHNSLIDFKKWLIEENDEKPLDPNVLRNELNQELFDYFFEIIKAAFNRPLPTLVNTDGELVQISTSYFRLTLPHEEALTRLLPMTLSNDPEEFLHDAKRTQSGKITRIDCPWLKKGNKTHKDWDNTVLGNIVIEENKLILETNSEERTKRGKKLLSKLLGDAISFQQTLIESPEQKMKSLPSSGNNSDLEMSKLMALPEVQEQMKAMAQAHWKSWFDEPIPALDNKTPREASKTADGKERLDALLLQYERHDLEKGEHPFKADINYLRTELALD